MKEFSEGGLKGTIVRRDRDYKSVKMVDNIMDCIMIEDTPLT
jgi:hypothetical protein